MTKSAITLIFSLGIYASLAFAGIHYGLPDSQHALSYNCDETTWLEALSYIRPEHNFNPHPHLAHPTLYLEMYAVSVFVAAKAGWIPLHQDKEWFRQHPEVFARFYLAGRYLQIACGVSLLLLMWLLARSVFNAWVANVSTILLSVTPSLISASHFSQASLPVCLFSFAALACLIIYAHQDYKDVRWIYGAAFVIGCAISAKFSALGLMPALACCYWVGSRQLKSLVAIASLIMVGFVLGSPFAALAPKIFWPAFFVAYRRAASSSTRFVKWPFISVSISTASRAWSSLASRCVLFRYFLFGRAEKTHRSYSSDLRGDVLYRDRPRGIYRGVRARADCAASASADHSGVSRPIANQISAVKTLR